MESNIILDKKIVSQLIDYWKHTDPCYQGEEGNSFFFTGGCLSFAAALGKFLIEHNKECQIVDLFAGVHVLLKFEDVYFDADGLYRDPLESLSNMDLNYDDLKEDFDDSFNNGYDVFVDEDYIETWSIESTKDYCLGEIKDIDYYRDEIFYKFYNMMISEIKKGETK